MEIPASTAAVAVLVGLLVPGLVYSTVRASITGYRGIDKSLSSRFASAVTISVLLNALYLALFGRLAYSAFSFVPAREQVVVVDPVGAGSTVIALGLATPALAALVVHVIPWSRVPWIRSLAARGARLGLIVVNRVPTAWDHAGRTRSDVFVRVTRADGTVVGGFYSSGSFMSGYPESRDLFVAQQWVLGTDGTFDRSLPSSAGLWIAIRGDDIIEWIRPDEEDV